MRPILFFVVLTLLGLAAHADPFGEPAGEPTSAVEISPERRVSKTGAVFLRAMGYPQLGEAWSDPTGLVWGNSVPRPENQALFSFVRAQAQCHDLGARLPRESEVLRLREYLGAESVDSLVGYEPAILPSMLFSDGVIRNGKPLYYVDSDTPDATFKGFVFDARFGKLDKIIAAVTYGISVRCVCDLF